MKRFIEIDGLRALAVLGVLWAHCWMFLGNPSLNIVGLPLIRIMSFGGAGVDLFFVISGFCMYYSFERKYKIISTQVFLNFVKNRWLRIAPIYYLVVLVYSVFFTTQINIKSIIYHFLFVQTLFDQNHIAAHFWSLATEWHFYLVLPFLFLMRAKKIGFNNTLYILMILCLICRIIQWGYVLPSPISIEKYDRIYFRFIEFAWGILVCKWYHEDFKTPDILLGKKGFIISLLIAFSGRLMNTTEVIDAFNSFGFMFRVLSEPVLSLGFALMLLNVIKSDNYITKTLNSPLFQKIGKVSYSFYLWHWMIASYTSSFLVNEMGNNNYTLFTAFILSALLTYFISVISYNLVEKRYFVKKGLRNNNLEMAYESL